MNIKISVLAMLALGSLVSSCSSAPPLSPWESPIDSKIATERSIHLMGSQFKIRIWKGGADTSAQGQGFQAAFSELRRIAKIADHGDPQSELSRVNQQAYKAPVLVSRELFNMLSLGQKLWTRSEGVFDITFVRIQEANEKNSEKAGLESGIQDTAEDVNRQLKSTVGSKFLALDPTALTVRFNKPRMKLAILGLAKGYAVQKAAEKLGAYHLNGFSVLGGGVLAAAGKALSDTSLMCLESPNQLGTCAYRVIPQSPTSVFIMGASAVLERPGHIYDAKNGLRKARTGGVTIAGTDGAVVQAATTATGAMDNAKILKFLEQKGDLPISGVFFESDYSITLHGKLDPYAKTALTR